MPDDDPANSGADKLERKCVQESSITYWRSFAV